MSIIERKEMIEEILDIMKDARETTGTYLHVSDDALLLAAEAAANVLIAFDYGYKAAE